ncbi:Metalloenzyme, LuxS/M16 peptidase-like protein [Aspergillus ambiguus]|uniref:ubiquinol--cytochrome-c reductase subunit 2 n=1 Tax=Aspergillus ambiguus TaxID=176160 RepID=UPI003CCDC854
MLSRSSFARNAPRALQKQCSVTGASGRRGMASATQFDVSESSGVKVANRETAGPTGTLALVAKAGSRYQPFPGFAEALDEFAFKSTLKRSGLRITREVELLGGEVSSTHSRENVVLTAKYLANDLPYFVELLAEVASQSKFAAHELQEIVFKHLKYRQQAFAANPEAQALDAAHAVAFHQGLGASVTPNTNVPFEKYLSADALAEYAQKAYSKSNVALVGTGSSSADLSKWVSQFFNELPSGSGPQSAASKYYGGEQRVSSKAGNAVVLAFPGSGAFGASAYKPEAAVLAALLGGQSTIKWTPGFSLLAKATQGFSQLRASTQNLAYSDAGLLSVSLAGQADQVAAASKNVVDALKKVAAGEVAAEDVKKAVALAKFRALDAAETPSSGLEATGSALLHSGKIAQLSEVAQSFDAVSEAQVKDAAKSLLSGKASVAAVGDLHQLPYGQDLGLTV